MANKDAVHNEILRLKSILYEKLKLRTANAGIGLTSVSMPPEQELAQDLLVDGMPKAFVEFFYLTTTLEPEPTNKEDEEAGIRFPVAEAQRTFKLKEVQSVLSRNLVAAERAARSGNNEKLFLALSGVGALFDKTCYYSTSVAYYKRALVAAMNVTSTRNTFHIAQAKYNLGKVYCKEQNWTEAISCFEDCLSLARFINDGQLVVLSAKELLEVYWYCAEERRKAEEYKESIQYFENCIRVAPASSNAIMGAEAKYNIGLLYGKLRETQSAVKCQNEYLDFSKKINNKAGECKADAALSEVYEADGNVSLAVHYLKSYLQAAAFLDPITRAVGHCLLGCLHKRHENREESLEQFHKYFQIARELKNPDLLDVSRVNIGIARELKPKRVSLGSFTLGNASSYWDLI